MAARFGYLIAFSLCLAISTAETQVQQITSGGESPTAKKPVDRYSWHRTGFLLCGVLCFLMLLHNEITRLLKVKNADDKNHKSLVKASTGVLQPGLRALAAVETPYRVWAGFVFCCSALYFGLGGSVSHLTISEALSMSGSIAESFGLVVLYQKIKRHRSVAGVSGMTMQLYAAAYTFRLYQVCPGFSLSSMAHHPSYDIYKFMYEWAVWGLCTGSYLQVLIIVRMIFVLYPRTYQKDLDTVPALYVTGSALVGALLLHPTMSDRWAYSIAWTTNMYLDCAALLPQVVMMATSGGKIKAPIAHFVAATAFSRSMDLMCWIDNIRVATVGFTIMPNINAAIIVLAHVFNLLLVCDFVWYYLKARVSGAALSEDLDICFDEV